MSKEGVVFAVTCTLSIAGCSPLPSLRPHIGEIKRIEQGLLPPVLAEDEPSWTLSERMAHYRVPGVSVAVIENFAVTWAKGYGVADAALGTGVTEETLFQAASISKPVTAAAVMRLVDTRRLTLDADVNSTLRAWKVPDNEFTQKQSVTFAHLLSHSAGTTVHGFPGYVADDPVPSLVQVLDGSGPANTSPVRADKTPGEGFRYSGGGTTIVQQALQDLSGLPFEAFMRSTVLRAAGMGRSTFEQPLPAKRVPEAAAGHLPTGQPIPGKRHTYPEQAAAGLWTTAGDLARFVVAIQRSARGDRGALLSRASAQRMLTHVAPPVGIGFFVDRPKPGYFGHGGSNEGFRCLLLAHRQKGYGAVVMTNGENADSLIAELMRSIAREYGWEAFLPEVLKPLDIEAGQLKAFEGRWRMGADSVVTLTARDRRLKATAALEPDFELIPIATNTFVRIDRPTRYSFSEDKPELRLLDDNGTTVSIARRAAEPSPSELFAQGAVRAALDAYRAALQAHSEDPTLSRARLNELANAVLLRGDTSAAVALLEIVAELYPASSLTRYSLAEAQIAQGDYKGAAATLRRALALAETDPDVAGFREAARYTASRRLRSLSGPQASRPSE